YFPYYWPVERLKRVEEFPPGLFARRRESCRYRLTLRNRRRSTARNPPRTRRVTSKHSPTPTILPKRKLLTCRFQRLSCVVLVCPRFGRLSLSGGPALNP